MEDLEEERGIQNFKSHLSALEREMKDFGSWIQTSLTQTKDHLGVGPKCQWPYAKRQDVDWVVYATMDHGIDKHTQDYTLLLTHLMHDPIIALQIYSMQQINVLFQLFTND
jgi:hypothetical protein